MCCKALYASIVGVPAQTIPDVLACRPRDEMNIQYSYCTNAVNRHLTYLKLD